MGNPVLCYMTLPSLYVNSIIIWCKRSIHLYDMVVKITRKNERVDVQRTRRRQYIVHSYGNLRKRVPRDYWVRFCYKRWYFEVEISTDSHNVASESASGRRAEETNDLKAVMSPICCGAIFFRPGEDRYSEFPDEVDPMIAPGFSLIKGGWVDRLGLLKQPGTRNGIVPPVPTLTWKVPLHSLALEFDAYGES